MPLQDGLYARAKLFKRNCRQNRARACGLESANAPIGRSNIPRDVAAAVSDVFIFTGAGDDAIEVASGSNVLDAGAGSNFLVGASGADGGADTFFLDAGNSRPTWDTLVNFHARDMVTIWDFMQGVGTTSWLANSAGASGYQGATLQINAGNGSSPNELVTFAGLSTQTAHFDITSGTTGGLDYLAVTRVS